jgi:hypothetical protein
LESDDFTSRFDRPLVEELLVEELLTGELVPDIDPVDPACVPVEFSCDGVACSSAAENDCVPALPADGAVGAGAAAGTPLVAICGTIAITVFFIRTLLCKQEAKIPGLETIPGVAPGRSQLKTFEDCAD